MGQTASCILFFCWLACLSTRCIAVNIFYVRLAGTILLLERDDVSLSRMISWERDDIWRAGWHFSVMNVSAFSNSAETTWLDLTSLMSVHRLGDRCQAGKRFTLWVELASYSMSWVHICCIDFSTGGPAGAWIQQIDCSQTGDMKVLAELLLTIYC